MKHIYYEPYISDPRAHSASSTSGHQNVMNRRILHERTYRGSMLQPEIDLRSTENARKRQNGKLSAWGSHLGHWGELRRRGLIAGRGELELGLPGTAITSDVERQQFLLAVL